MIVDLLRNDISRVAQVGSVRVDDLFTVETYPRFHTMTSGISAEYGRFSGGVINMITKSGGNSFSGSFRANFTNEAWTRETPREVTVGTTRADKLNQNYEGTFGGPVLRDRAES